MSSRRQRRPEAGANIGAARSLELGAPEPGSNNRAQPSERRQPDDRSASEDLERTCRRTAVDLLARREHSRLELERKLASRSHSPTVVAGVLDALEAEGLLVAERFIESFVRARVAKGQGPVRIVLELAQRGIDDGGSFVHAAGYDWQALAGAARVKRFGPALPGDFKARAKQARFLEYRGFTGEQIAAALEIGADSD